MEEKEERSERYLWKEGDISIVSKYKNVKPEEKEESDALDTNLSKVIDTEHNHTDNPMSSDQDGDYVDPI